MKQVTAKMVAELRKSTACSTRDCKKALQESDCDMDEAVGWLRRNARPQNGAMISYNWTYIHEKAKELQDKIDELYKELRSLPTHELDGLK